uniref:Gag-pol polyprotein n=1 Tax=Solanum tuberosum TaxID=4113 RepID=M1DQP8_SOLTU
MQEFINLHLGSMIMKEYALKFTKLSKYALTIVADSWAKMNKFVMGVSDMVVKECRTTMLVQEMDIHDSWCMRNKWRKINLKKGIGRLKEQGPVMGTSPVLCLMEKVDQGLDKDFPTKRDCPVLMAKGREDNQAPPNGSNSNAPKKNRFYALQNRGVKENSPDVVTGMLKVFHIDVSRASPTVQRLSDFPSSRLHFSPLLSPTTVILGEPDQDNRLIP